MPPFGIFYWAFGIQKCLASGIKAMRNSACDYPAKKDGKVVKDTTYLIDDAREFMGWYFAATQAELGISMADARNQYLAYHEGRSGYRRGTYNKKQWLMRVANQVAQRAVTYEAQLVACGRR